MIYCGSCKELWGVRINATRNQHVYYCRNRENRWGNRLPNRNIPECNVKRSANITQLDDLIWRSIIRLNEDSHILREKDKSLILQPINPNKSRSWKQRINYLEKQITGLEDKKSFMYQQFISDEIDKKMLDELNKKIKKQMAEFQVEMEELEVKINMKTDKDGFIDWVGKRQNKISGMSKITVTKKKIEIIKDFVDRVWMEHDKKKNVFQVTITLKLPLFNDKLVWNNARDKSKGYNISEGEIMKTFDLPVVSGRPKIDDENKKREPHYL